MDNLCENEYLDLKGLLYYHRKIQKIIQDITTNFDWTKLEERFGIKAGPTISRPESDLIVGLIYFDTDLNQPIWWNGNQWVNSNGDNADIPHKGNTDKLPNAKNVSVGFVYYDTDTNTMYMSNGESWDIINCCGNIEDVIIWANLFGDIITYAGYDYIGWSNLDDDSYEDIEDLDTWTNI